MNPKPSKGRSHPPSLRRLVERIVHDEHLFVRGDTVLVACSGGPDSQALLHVLAHLAKTLGVFVMAHGVDHGLRPEATAELALAADLCAKLDVPFDVSRVDVPRGSNLQARAREARHQALEDAASKRRATVIALGHTADDRAETFLLRLLRGSGPKGLAVLPARSPSVVAPGRGRDLVRPLLYARRADVMTHLTRHALSFAADPSNLDPRFLRVRVRLEVLPLLTELSPRITEHLCALADMLSEARFSEQDESVAARFGGAQRTMIQRARRAGARNVKIRVKGGDDVLVAFPDGKIVLNEKK